MAHAPPGARTRPRQRADRRGNSGESRTTAVEPTTASVPVRLRTYTGTAGPLPATATAGQVMDCDETMRRDVSGSLTRTSPHTAAGPPLQSITWPAVAVAGNGPAVP